jgi:ABC-type Fe3+-hydroxamate transport system substrate-binding protein
VEELRKFAPVWVSDIGNLNDGLSMIGLIGEIINKNEQAYELVTTIRQDFQKLSPIGQYHQAVYLIWKEPYMTIGGDTFISDIMERAGFINVFKHLDRYPEITVEQLKDTDCNVVLLSSEPYPFKEKDMQDLQALLPGKKILLVDGEMFSWYGSRLQYAPAYFNALFKQKF